MIKIEVYNREITEAAIEGNTVEILADLGVIIDTTINLIADEDYTKEEVLDELTRLLKEAWIEFDKEDEQ